MLNSMRKKTKLRICTVISMMRFVEQLIGTEQESIHAISESF